MSETVVVPRRVYAVSAETTRVTGEKPPTKYWETLMHFVKAYVGTGIFAMGDAYKNSGILLGPLLVLTFGLVNLFCQHKLVLCAKRLAEKEPIEVHPTFAETVQYTFLDGPEKFQGIGKVVARTTNIFIGLTELSFCCIYYLFIADHLIEVAAANDYELRIQYMFLIMFIPMWLIVTCLSNLKVLVPLSIIANTLLWIGICIIYYYTSQDLPPLSDRPLITTHPETIPLAVGTALFAFEGITFILPLKNEMGRPETFTMPFGVLNMGFFIVLCLYASVGFMAFYKYGDDIQGSVFLNMPEKEVLAMSVKALMALATCATYALHYYVCFEVTYPDFYDTFGPFNRPKLAIFGYKTASVVIIYIAANAIPFLELFISLIGCIFGSILAIIMPPILELLSYDPERKLFTVIVDITIVIIGVLGMILGIVISVYFIVLAFMKEYGD